MGFPILEDVWVVGAGGTSASTSVDKGDMPCVYSALKHSQFWLYHSGTNGLLLILRPGCW